MRSDLKIAIVTHDVSDPPGFFRLRRAGREQGLEEAAGGDVGGRGDLFGRASGHQVSAGFAAHGAQSRIQSADLITSKLGLIASRSISTRRREKFQRR